MSEIEKIKKEIDYLLTEYVIATFAKEKNPVKLQNMENELLKLQELKRNKEYIRDMEILLGKRKV